MNVEYAEALMEINSLMMSELDRLANMVSNPNNMVKPEVIRSLLGNFKQKKDVDWDALENIKPGEYLALGRNSYGFYIPTAVPYQKMFYTIMGEDALIDEHRHLTFHERIWKFRGEGEIYYRGKWREMREYTHFEPGEIHACRSRFGQSIYVEFTNTNHAQYPNKS